MVQLVASLYRLLLYLYPRRFQEEFGVEMAAVFATSLVEASEAGWWRAAAVCLRELRDLPVSAACEDWHQLTMAARLGLVSGGYCVHTYTVQAGGLSPVQLGGR